MPLVAKGVSGVGVLCMMTVWKVAETSKSKLSDSRRLSIGAGAGLRAADF